MRSHWERGVFEIVRKKDQLPVYIIQNLSKKKDQRTVHRNLLMECNDLPKQIFEDVQEKALKEQKKEQTKCKKKKVNFEQMETVENDNDPDSDGDDLEIILHQEMPDSLVGREVMENTEYADTEVQGGDQVQGGDKVQGGDRDQGGDVVEGAVELALEIALDVAEPVPDVLEVAPEDETVSEPELNHVPESETEPEPVEPEHGDDPVERESDGDGSPQLIRRSTRVRRPTQRPDYHKLGGVPKLVEIQRPKR